MREGTYTKIYNLMVKIEEFFIWGYMSESSKNAVKGRKM